MYQHLLRPFGLFISASLISACAFAGDPGAVRNYLRSFTSDDPGVVSTVDYKRYVGLWYEIAHAPNFFQGGCIRSTEIQGTATAPDPSQPAKLKVDFGFVFDGDYWIIDLDPNYEWAVVSGPKKSSLFILSRTAPMEPQLLRTILDRLESQGFKMDELIFDQY